MTVLTENQIIENYQKLIVIAKHYIKEPLKLKKVVELLEDERISNAFITAPASSFAHFHGAYPGGLVQHTLNVIDIALKLTDNIYAGYVADVDYTEEELVFSAMFHDLGKIGSESQDLYIPNDSEWHVKNQGKMYNTNPKLEHMHHADRSLQILAKWGIPVSEKEWISIRIHEGAFDPMNDFYYKSFSLDSKLKTSLPYIVHLADFLSARIEFVNDNFSGKQAKKATTVKPKSETKTSDYSIKDKDTLFETLFNNDKKD